MIAYDVSLVTKEVNLCETFVLNVSESIGLVPSCGKDVKGYLTADGINEVVVWEFFLQGFDECATNLRDLTFSVVVNAKEGMGKELLVPYRRTGKRVVLRAYRTLNSDRK